MKNIPFREKTIQTKIKGLVQGVGFRPFIYQLATKYKLNGWVENRNDGVIIKTTGLSKRLDQFINSIRKSAPIASNIDSIEINEIELEHFQNFRIIKSNNISDQITDICPDIATCSDCLNDIKMQKNRINYPFINCTNCGPRFTIINALPYDRDKTTMNDFIMCQDCKKEYTSIVDRRFHAQPIACSVCGPEYSLWYKNKEVKEINKIVNILVSLVNKGKIIAIKGLGGYFIICDALNEETVKRLRNLKNKEAKPFAVMFSNVKTLRKYALIDKNHEVSLLSWKRPIVLLKQKKDLAFSVNVGFKTIGVMLPYMPLHFLLFEKLKIPAIVLTSGNISDEPIIIDNETAFEKLIPITDAILTYNRNIQNRTDDSVVNIINNKERIIRRSRGYVPTPINLKINVNNILATGAELVNSFCIGKDNQAILSQHIGDLKNIDTFDFYLKTIEQFKKLYRFKPSIIVSDMHPNYLSTQYAEETGLKHIKVQHHHAHIVSCMAEHNIDEKVIGVSFDGVGLGDDNNIWGSEFFVCDLKEYTRVNHFEYIPTPGGDKATSEPWRMAVSYLYKIYGKDFLKLNLPFLNNINPNNVELIINAIDKKVNCPLTSSSGRLFDAVAAMINLCSNNKFHAEAPMRLESIIEDKINEEYQFSINKNISFQKTIEQIVNDIKQNVKPSIISAKFHNTIISIIIETVKKISKQYQLNKIVLSGGTFQNKYILEKVETILTNNKFEVFSHYKIPTNDGGISLGQLVIAAKTTYN